MDESGVVTEFRVWQFWSNRKDDFRSFYFIFHVVFREVRNGIRVEVKFRNLRFMSTCMDRNIILKRAIKAESFDENKKLRNSKSS